MKYVFLWTIDDFFDCELACLYLQKIKSRDYCSAGGARRHGTENFIKLSKKLAHSDYLFERICDALDPYDSFIYFLVRKK